MLGFRGETLWCIYQHQCSITGKDELGSRVWWSEEKGLVWQCCGFIGVCSTVISSNNTSPDWDLLVQLLRAAAKGPGHMTR